MQVMTLATKNPKIGQLIELPENRDKRGALCFVEAQRHVPFEIKRSFWIYDVPKGISRGHHAHRQSKQAHVCLHGSATVSLNNGWTQEFVVLDKPNMILVLEPMIWHHFTLKRGSLLFVYASDIYNPKDYIRNYEEFLQLVRMGPLS